ncbi:MAG: alpha/beta fold hydrolase [Myxococcota bacterium]
MHGFQTHTLTARDGVRLAVHDRPHPDPGAPVLFLANGLGGNLPTWRHLIARFGASHRIVSWDYRGLYGSALTPEQKEAGADVTIGAHVDDAAEVFEHLEIEQAVLVGWSMGVQLGFDLYPRVRDRVEGIVAMSGGYGLVFRNTIMGAVGPRLIMPGMDIVRHGLTRFGESVLKAARSPLVLASLKRLGVVARSLDDRVFLDLVREYVQLDFEIYNRILESLDDHDVRDVLPQVDAPVLVMAGDRDPMTPQRLSRQMLEILPDAELTILPGGTHYVPVEFPGKINRRIETFLSTRLCHRIES